MSLVKIAYTPKEIVDPATDKRTFLYIPTVDLVLIGPNRQPSVGIRCLLDTGADYNVFPAEYALCYLGLTEKKLERGIKLKLLGIGGVQRTAYGHKIKMVHPEFSIQTVIYFLENQAMPLLGRRGFMDKFEKIVLNEEMRTLELEKR